MAQHAGYGCTIQRHRHVPCLANFKANLAVVVSNDNGGFRPTGAVAVICTGQGTSAHYAVSQLVGVGGALVASHALTREDGRRPAARFPRNGLLQLGWPHYWLLVGVLGGMLALVAMVFLITVVAS